MINMSTSEQKFIDLMKQITAYSEAIALIHWDLRTHAPKKGIDQRSKHSAYSLKVTELQRWDY